MLLQRCSTGERFVAYGAGVRFIACVDPHVDFQPAVPGERFPALLADHVLPLFVLPDHVLVQIFLGDHPPLAHLALVLGLVMGEFLMHVQRIAVQTRFPANVADNRLLLVAETYVVSEITFHFEFLAASLARELEVVRVLPGHVDLQFVLVLVLVVALVAVEQLRLAVVGARFRHLVLPLYMRVQRRLFVRLEHAFVARVHVADLHDFVLPFVRVQGALFRTLEVAEIAPFLGHLLRRLFLGRSSRDRRSKLAFALELAARIVFILQRI